MGRKPTSVNSLFDNCSPEPNSGCWIWMGALSIDGRYGSASYLDKTERAHRLMFKLTNGEIPAGIKVLHKCDVMLCINPDHLFLGTDADNMADKTAKNRQAKGIQCNHPHRVFNDSSVREVRKLRKQGRTLQEIAGLFATTKSSISNIVNEKTWRHVL